jgi:hypothetical protein
MNVKARLKLRENLPSYATTDRIITGTWTAGDPVVAVPLGPVALPSYASTVTSLMIPLDSFDWIGAIP